MEQNESYSINRLNEMTGIDRRTLKKQLANVAPNAAGEYRASDVLEIIRNRSPRAVSRKAAAEVRKIELQCERIAFENDVRRGKFIDRDQVRLDLTRFILTAKKLLLSVPSSECQILAMLTDPVAIEQRLKGRVREVLQTLHTAKYGVMDCPQCGHKLAAMPKETPNEKETIPTPER